jgi:2-oxoglutarate dehydrogenase E1 component
MEGDPPAVDRRVIVDRLMRAAIFEQVLQSRYIGNKRFSIEGVESLIPLLAEVLETAAEQGTPRAMLAMSRRPMCTSRQATGSPSSGSIPSDSPAVAESRGMSYLGSSSS